MNEKKFNECLKNIRDRRYFDILYHYYYRRIVIHINRKYKMGALSEDVAQETFINLLSMDNCKHIEFYTSWLYKISDNIALRKLDRESNEQKKLSCDNEEITPEDAEMFGDLQKSVENMDLLSQRIFYYHYVESYTLKEIAGMLNMTRDNVRQKHHRGIKFLRKNKKASHFMLLNVFR